MEEGKQHLQELLSLALLMPTKENVQRFAAEQSRWVGQSALFAEKWEETATFPKTDFLLFCFRGQDPSSREGALVAKEFAKTHSWTLKALSLDGQGTDDLDTYEVDRGIGRHLGVETSPSFYVIDVATNQGIQVGEGTISVDELAHNIEALCVK